MDITPITTGFSAVNRTATSHRPGGADALGVEFGASIERTDSIQAQPVTEVRQVPGESGRVDAGADDKSYSRAHGVLRLLEAGHFKATPEARLRTLFADELGEVSQPETPVEPTTTAIAFTDSISTRAEELLAPFAADAQTAEELAAAIDTFKQTAGSVDLTRDASAIEESLRTAFDDLLATATALLDPANATEGAGEPAQPVDGAINVGDSVQFTGIELVDESTDLQRAATPTAVGPTPLGSDEAPPAFGDAISLLTAAFEDALRELMASLRPETVDHHAIDEIA